MVSFRRMAVFIALAGLMVGLVSVAKAAHTPEHKKSQAGQREITGRVGAPEMVLRGPVVSVDSTVGFLVVQLGAGKDAEEIPVEIDAKTTLTRAGKTVSLNEVRPGDRVTVRYAGQGGDVSKMVEVAPGPATRAGKRAM